MNPLWFHTESHGMNKRIPYRIPWYAPKNPMGFILNPLWFIVFLRILWDFSERKFWEKKIVFLRMSWIFVDGNLEKKIIFLRILWDFFTNPVEFFWTKILKKISSFYESHRIFTNPVGFFWTEILKKTAVIRIPWDFLRTPWDFFGRNFEIKKVRRKYKTMHIYTMIIFFLVAMVYFS